ncbi:hypothetical protein [Rubritalea tangerina]|uniref:hypothetical protein n=1 Tax=Rubritalea tangerina TaxID=430798 RepID=UPI0036115BBA
MPTPTKDLYYHFVMQKSQMTLRFAITFHFHPCPSTTSGKTSPHEAIPKPCRIHHARRHHLLTP